MRLRRKEEGSMRDKKDGGTRMRIRKDRGRIKDCGTRRREREEMRDI